MKDRNDEYPQTLDLSISNQETERDLDLLENQSFDCPNIDQLSKKDIEVIEQAIFSLQDGRLKLSDQVINKKGTEIMELSVYPEYRVEGDFEGIFMGWLDKIRDDSNYVIRRLLAGEEGVPSLDDLLFPYELYTNRYANHSLRSSYFQ
ncbi:MAG: hypothetical protein NZL96_02535 [Patescibacteria group bacterium]|nr:hypothetical protein [Patescibacteria group bacterium]